MGEQLRQPDATMAKLAEHPDGGDNQPQGENR